MSAADVYCCFGDAVLLEKSLLFMTAAHVAGLRGFQQGHGDVGPCFVRQVFANNSTLGGHAIIDSHHVVCVLVPCRCSRLSLLLSM